MFSLLGNYRTLQVHSQNCLKDFFCQNVTLQYLFQKQEYWKYFARSKLIDQHEREKLVQAGAVLVLFFLIGKLEDLTSSYSKLFEKLLFLKCYTGFFVPKTRLLEIFGKD